MTNYVYKLTFFDRKILNQKPFFYIGYKTNATYRNGLLYDKHNKPYYSSSKSKILLDEVKNNPAGIIVDILYQSEDPSECQNKEREFQLENDVILNPDYFNMAITPINVFNLPNYGSYKHRDYPDKKVRLPRDHELVLSGIYVGITKGMKIDKSSIRGIGNFKDINGNIIRCRIDDPRVQSGDLVGITKGRELTKKERDSMSLARRGKPKSEDHKRKIGEANKGNKRPDVVKRFTGTKVFENIITGEKKRAPKDYEEENWLPHRRVGRHAGENHNHYNTIWINDGFIEKKLKAELIIPHGWKRGRIKCRLQE